MAVLVFIVVLAFNITFHYMVLMTAIIAYAGSCFTSKKFIVSGHGNELIYPTS